jgi:signal recognition particle subunit SRP54
MGDVLTLIEKAEQVYEADEAEQAAQRLLEGTFTLDDFLDQMQAIRKMGPLSGLMAMMPGIPKEVRDVEIGDKEIGRVEAIIRSMTMAERVDPDTIDTSRRTRIAKGAGVQPTEVAQLLSQFKEMRKMMQQMGAGTIKKVKKKNAKKKGKSGGRPGGRTTPKGSVAQPKTPYMIPCLDPLAAEIEKLGLDLPELK